MAAHQTVCAGGSILKLMKCKSELTAGGDTISKYVADFPHSLKTLVAQLLCNLNKKTHKRVAASASENERRGARAVSYRSETVGRR